MGSNQKRARFLCNTPKFQDTPKKLTQYLKAARIKNTKNITRLPETGMVLRGQKAEAGRLNDYNLVCGFKNTDMLPITYPHMLAFPLHMELMTQKDFPFPLLGVVHVRNNITQHRTIAKTETLDIFCRTGNLFGTDKGLEFEIITEVRTANEKDELVWESSSTMLNRGHVPDSVPLSPEKEDLYTEQWITEKWQVKSDIGRRYAKVSGDSTPFHLPPLTAKLFGFPRHIAHGMWTKAKALAEMEKIYGPLESKAEIQVQFKTPMLLPANVCFSHKEVDSQYYFKLTDKNDEKPHLAGRINLL